MDSEKHNSVTKQRSWWKRIVPTSLFHRALLILVLPMVLVQISAMYFFYERHWASISRNMSLALVGDVALIVHKTHYASDTERNKWRVLAKHLLNMDIEFIEDRKIDKRKIKEKSLAYFYRDLKNSINLPISVGWFTSEDDKDARKIEINIQLKDSVLNIKVNRKRLVNSTTYIFAMWTIGFSILLLIIATIFLRNQIRPITDLAVAAERFGMGDDSPNFHPHGAKEVRQAARAFIVMRNRIKKQIETRSAMLAGISHDLKTPLTRMKLELAMLSDKETKEALEKDIEEMQYMIQEYLDYAKGVSGESPKEVELRKFLEDIVNSHNKGEQLVSLRSYEQEGEGKERSNSSDSGKDIGLSLRPRVFRRAIDNLIINAIRYGKECKIAYGSTAGGRVRITIDDNGAGIPENMQEEVFRAFTRLDESRNNQTGGVGLGLSIARDIVQAHGGSISLENRKDDEGNIYGLRVTILLPALSK